ncbi:unnamed protein product, partial [Phaeothamnion confervicola]
WVDDAADLPLRYTFAYVVGPTDDAASEVIVRQRLARTSATVQLPQGGGAASTVIAIAYIEDIWGASTRVTYAVVVKPYAGKPATLANKTAAMLADYRLSGDTDGIFQVVGLANGILNSVNCTAAPDCAALNRDECSATTGAGRCGRCLSGHAGVNAFVNEACILESAVPSHCSNSAMDFDETDVDCGGGSCGVCVTGSSCTANSDCEFYSCVGAVCTAATKPCPHDCSDHGTCVYYDNSGSAVNSTECTWDRIMCYAVCSCDTGYNGSACQYTTAEFVDVYAVRKITVDVLNVMQDFLIDTDQTASQLAS